MSAPAVESKELSLQEIRKNYPNLWVAMVVTKRDTNGQPTAGRVVADDADRYRLRDKIILQNDVCVFYAGDPLYPLFL
jgi:hypothetical protein